MFVQMCWGSPLPQKFENYDVIIASTATVGYTTYCSLNFIRDFSWGGRGGVDVCKVWMHEHLLDFT